MNWWNYKGTVIVQHKTDRREYFSVPTSMIINLDGTTRRSLFKTKEEAIAMIDKLKVENK